jgi:phosphatidylglycerol:prolipoprotein diacylglycerol transferase
MSTGFDIGPLTIRYYGIILMLGAVAGAYLADRLARRRKIDPDIVWDALIWVIVGGIIGARLWHVFFPSAFDVQAGLSTRTYLLKPLDILAVWKGGLGIPGAVIGGGIALYWFSRRRKVNFAVLADIAAPALALGQAIGRWGNFVNQELYGPPSNLPWAITIDPAHRNPAYQDVATYHPLFLYESLWNLLNMFALIWIGRRYADRLRSGDVFLFYLIFYPVGRFLLEFLRLDPAQVGGVNANQATMVVVAVAAAALLFWRHQKQPAQAAE